MDKPLYGEYNYFFIKSAFLPLKWVVGNFECPRPSPGQAIPAQAGIHLPRLTVLARKWLLPTQE